MISSLAHPRDMTAASGRHQRLAHSQVANTVIVDAQTRACLLGQPLGHNPHTLKNAQNTKALCKTLAEGEGFEPSIRFPVYTLSKRAPSAARCVRRSLPDSVGALKTGHADTGGFFQAAIAPPRP